MGEEHEEGGRLQTLDAGGVELADRALPLETRASCSAMTSLAFAMPDPTLDTSGIVLPPSNLSSDEPEMESYVHLTQMILLLESEPLAPDAGGRLWSAQLGLFLAVYEGTLRLFTAEGALLPAAMELAQQAEAAERRSALLAGKLRELGVDPDSVK